jgi:serine/threonine protein kinase
VAVGVDCDNTSIFQFSMSNDSDPTVTIYQQYCPQGVKRVLASGSSAFIGEIDDSTVFKYPLAPGGEMNRLEVERKLLEIVGRHERIIGLKGFSEKGLYLERALNGTVADYILASDRSLSLRQRLLWCREVAEAVAWIHARRVLHCDIQPTNLLLDKELHIKLSDFQGKQLSENGEVLLDGWSSEPCRFYCPRDDPFDANIKTDLFALGCTIYFIMVGHAVFPDIIDGEDNWHEKVEHRFVSRHFPHDQHACSTVTLKCWQKEYENATAIVRDLESLESLDSS